MRRGEFGSRALAVRNEAGRPPPRRGRIKRQFSTASGFDALQDGIRRRFIDAHWCRMRAPKCGEPAVFANLAGGESSSRRLHACTHRA